IQPRRPGLRRSSPSGLCVDRILKAQPSQRLVDDAKRETRFGGIAAANADPEVVAARRGRPLEHGGLAEPRLADDKQAAPPTLVVLRQQALDRPQCRVALPDMCLGYAPPS